MGEKRGMQALEIWCKRATAGYRGVNVTNMTSSWRDGMAFCAMIHHFRPDLIDFASLCPSNVYANNELAFTVAETHLGIPALLDPEDMVKCAVPDRLSILTYLSQFYQVLASKGTSPLIGSVKRPSDSTPFNASSAGGSPVKVLTQQLHQEESPKGGRRPDLCVTCQNAVFLAERLLVNSKLHHRTCFRCARCASQLSLANYYETEKGQYCCETCPDEVVVDDSEPCPVVCTSSRPSSPCDQVNRGTAEAAPASATADITASATSFTPTKLQFLHSLVSVPLQDPGPDAPPQSQPVTEPDDPPSGGQHRPTAAADAAIEPTSETPAGDSAPTRDLVLKDQVLDDRPVEPLPDVCATTPVDAQVADLSIASDADAAVVAVEASPENPFDTASESEEAATDRPTEDVAAVSSTVDDAADTSPDDSTVQSPSDAVAEEQPAVVVVEEEPAAVVVEEEPAVVLVEEEPDVVVGDEEPAAAVVEEEPAVVVVVEEEPDVVVGEQATLGKDEEATGDMKSSANEPIISIRVTGPEEEEKQQQQDVPEEVVVPIPRRRSRRRTDETTTTTAAAAAVSSPTKAEAEAEYPDDLNPFGDEDDEAEASRATDTSSCTLNPFGSDDGDDSDVVTAQPPRVSLNPFGSDDEDEDEVQRRPKNKPQRPPPPSMTPTLSPTPTFSRTSSYKKRPAPPPPTPPTSAMASLRRKEKPAPPPPPPAPTLEAQQRLSADSDSDVVRREKSAKELSNLTVQCGVNKDSHGQWKRKKGPAPPRPMPQKRQLRKQPLKMIQQELTDIEAKQLELERQGVALERTIRAVTDSEAEALVPAGVEVEEMILQLFDLVNEKNELLRRQTELMYVRRQQRLEEEHAELEFQIRCLLEKPPAEKTDDDRVREEELIQRLVHVVHRRAEIVDCLELERRREFEEDQSIQQHLEVFNSRSPDAAATTSSPTVLPPKAPSKSKTLKLIQSPIKLMKKDKHKKASKKVHDADKDIDESESESASPAKASASGADADAAAAAKETDKDKKKSKSWFNK